MLTKMSTKKLRSMLDDVLSEISPSEALRKEVLGKVRVFLESINARLKKLKISARACLGGSYAKDTWLLGDYDVDVFVLFGKKHAHESLSDLLAKALEPWNPERLHGSRDYFQIKNGIEKGIAYEFVPVLDIKKSSDAKNTTDFSPLHVAWVTAKGKKLKNDIRLFKKFCKANQVYGAESYIRGVSGHVADLLIIEYDGFLNALKAIKKWKPKVILDSRNVYEGKAMLIMNASKTEGPLIIVDPVQPERNAASAFSQEKCDLLIKASQKFMKKPSRAFFEEQHLDWKRLQQKKCLVKFSCVPLDGKPDVVGTKMLKVFEYVREQLAEFGVQHAGWEWKETSPATMWFVLKHAKISDTVVVQGPPLSMKEHVLHFKQKHKHTFVKGKKILANVSREHARAELLAQHLLSSGFVQERVKSCRLEN